MPLLALIHFHDLFGVDGQVLIRVDDHTEQARVGLKEKGGKQEWVSKSDSQRHAHFVAKCLLPLRTPSQPDVKAPPGAPGSPGPTPADLPRRWGTSTISALLVEGSLPRLQHCCQLCTLTSMCIGRDLGQASWTVGVQLRNSDPRTIKMCLAS